MSVNQREKQMAEAEEILGDRLQKASFVKGLFFGQHLGERLPKYPHLGDDKVLTAREAELRAFLQQEVDPVAIDRNAEIPQSVIDGLGRIGVLGACLPEAVGGQALSQTQ